MAQDQSEGQHFTAVDQEAPRKLRNGSRKESIQGLVQAAYESLSEEERYIISSSLGRLIEGILRSGQAIFLEGLGIIFPETSSIHKSYVVDDRLAIRKENTVALNFEKCVELLSLHRERFGYVVESRELAARLYPSLPLLMQLRISVDQLKRVIQGLVKAIRAEVVSQGVSRRLDKVGTLYALHNRHGSTPSDWFAGADIFLVSPIRWVQSVEKSVVYDRPVLENASELLAAAFGQAIDSFTVDVAAELSRIPGVQTVELPKELAVLSISVFQSGNLPEKDDLDNRQRGRCNYVFCTEGMRGLGIGPDPRRALRCELTMEIPVDNSEQIPDWPKRAFALAALIVAQQLLGKDCAWLGTPVALAEATSTRLEAILLQRYAAVGVEQLSPEGEFSYVNIIGITKDELELADTEGLSHLLALLRRKGLEQITKLDRNSVIAKTAVRPPEPPQVFGSRHEQVAYSTLQ